MNLASGETAEYPLRLSTTPNQTLKLHKEKKKRRTLFQVLPFSLPDIDNLYGYSRIHSQEDIEEFLPGDN